jgi:hypothetical protein
MEGQTHSRNGAACILGGQARPALRIWGNSIRFPGTQLGERVLMGGWYYGIRGFLWREWRVLDPPFLLSVGGLRLRMPSLHVLTLFCL